MKSKQQQARRRKEIPMGIRASLKKLVYEEDQPTAAKGSPPPAPTTTTASPAVAAAVAPPVEVDPKFLGALREAVTEDLPEAFLTFLKQLSALKNVVADPATRYRAAFTTSGIMLAQLRSVAEDRLRGLDGHVQQFADDLNARRKSETSQAETRISAIEEQLRSLREQQTQLEAERQELRGKADQAKLRTDEALASFNQAAAVVRAELEADLSNIKAHIQG